MGRNPGHLQFSLKRFKPTFAGEEAVREAEGFNDIPFWRRIPAPCFGEGSEGQTCRNTHWGGREATSAAFQLLNRAAKQHP